MRDALFQTDGYVRLETDFRAKKPHCPHHQIFLRGRNGRIVAGEIEPAFVAELEGQPIENSDRRDKRIDVMKAVLASSQDAKAQVDLGRC